MAYHDENGRITIDEFAAQRDINKLKTAKSSLNSVLNSLFEIRTMSSSFRGDFSNIQIEKANELITRVKKEIALIDYEIDLIRATVRKYQAIDAKIKENINSLPFGHSHGGGFR